MAINKKRDGSKGTSGVRPPFEKYYIYIFLIGLALMFADLSILQIRSYLLPDPAGFVKPEPRQAQLHPKDVDFRSIADRNLFNRKGLIPPALGSNPQNGEEDNAAPVLSQLPLELVGTIVHANEARSIATVSVKGQNKIIPVAKGDNIAEYGVTEKVERGKLIFRNSNSNRLEYIELAKEGEVSFGTVGRSAAAPVGKSSRDGDVQAISETEFVVSKASMNKYLSQLPEVLQQAVTQPVVKPDGTPGGYKLIDMQPNSIFEKLGLQRGDVLVGADGNRIDNPAAAMRAFNSLKNNPNVSLDIERGGRSMNLNYNIKP